MTSSARVEPEESVELPPVYISEKSASELVSYFDEVAQLEPELSVKAQLEHFESAPDTLSGALDALLQRKVAGVQLRYSWQGQRYIDTVLVSERSYRVVRIESL